MALRWVRDERTKGQEGSIEYPFQCSRCDLTPRTTSDLKPSLCSCIPQSHAAPVFIAMSTALEA